MSANTPSWVLPHVKQWRRSGTDSAEKARDSAHKGAWNDKRGGCAERKRFAANLNER
jgi:hypothetical protein